MRPRHALLAVFLTAAAPGWAQPAGSVTSAFDTPAVANGLNLEGQANTWKSLRPMQMLELLQQHPGRTLWLYLSPPGWIDAEELGRLRELVTSDTPTAITCPFVAAHLPRAGASSTIGREARGMIRAAERGGAWPSSCSDL